MINVKPVDMFYVYHYNTSLTKGKLMSEADYKVLHTKATKLGLINNSTKIMIMRLRQKASQVKFYESKNAYFKLGYLCKTFEARAIVGQHSIVEDQVIKAKLTDHRYKAVTAMKFEAHELFYLIRLNQHHSQEDVGEVLGCSRVWVNMYENGKLNRYPFRYDKMTARIVKDYIN